MRLGFKSTLGLLIGYLALIAAFGLGVDHWLRTLEESMCAGTVRLLAREQSNLIVERSLETIAFGDQAAQRRLRERIQDLTLLSQVVASATVVARDGRVVASDDPQIGSRLPPVSSLGDPPQARVEPARERSFLRGGDYTALLPLVQGDEVAGYLRLVLHDRELASLYQTGRFRLLGLSTLGLLGVALLGVFLQLQLSRRANAITAVLEGTPGPVRRLVPSDEFARALQAANRVRGALEEARRGEAIASGRPGTVGPMLRVGVVVLRSDLEAGYVSERALELLGCPDRAAFSGPATRLRDGVRNALLGAVAREDGSRKTTLDVAPGGRRLSAEIHPLTAEEGGGHLVLLSDPQAIEALEADARLASQLEGLGRVYRAMAHELKAPLSAMMINLDLLRESLTIGEAAERERQQRQRRYVDVLRDELNRLNRSLYGILTQTVPETKALEFDLGASLQDLATLLHGQARKQGVTLETRLGTDPLTVRGYPDRLRQAFLNFAVNALEAMPKGGRLSIDSAREGDHAQVVMHDTGGGISPPVREKIFDMDFSTKKGGSGVGLYVARALVELHGGEVRVESQMGQGTSVHVTLPIAGGAA